jgi:uncharacterized tellurite resistance protein B-like protein
MLERVLSFIVGDATVPHGHDDLKLAVAALLVEAARMDDTFEPSERAVITRLLAERFDLDANAADQLLAAAECAEAGSSGVYRFTKQVVDAYGTADRIGLIEMMWEVVYADGVLDPDEDALVRRIAGLIHVEDRDRGEARRRVLARQGRSDPT